jgi:glucokinase
MTFNSYVLAGDVGGTNLRIAAVDGDGNILHLAKAATPQTGVVTDIVDAIVSAAESCIAAVEGGDPDRFGLAVAALVDTTGPGRILGAPNLPQLNGLPLADLVSDRLDLGVILENDATAAAVGEHWLGSSRDVENSIFVTLGTGIGGGLILHGRPYRGTDGTAGEIGHICVEPEGIECGCGSRGCVEQYASASAIVRIARELLHQHPTSVLRHHQPDFSSKDVYEAAIGGDHLSLKVFRAMGSYLGVALADLVNVLNPELIIIGGKVAAGWDLFIEDVSAEIKERAFPYPAETVVLQRALLGDSAGILGAARVAFDQV